MAGIRSECPTFSLGLCAEVTSHLTATDNINETQCIERLDYDEMLDYDESTVNGRIARKRTVFTTRNHRPLQIFFSHSLTSIGSTRA